MKNAPGRVVGSNFTFEDAAPASEVPLWEGGEALSLALRRELI